VIRDIRFLLGEQTSESAVIGKSAIFFSLELTGSGRMEVPCCTWALSVEFFSQEAAMPDSLFSVPFQAVLDAATGPAQPAFPSPADWRDQWIYFLMVDRFNNVAAAPLHLPFDDPNCFQYQGGKFSGIRAQLPYIKGLGAGAVWLSPVLKNAMFDQGSYHGYGIQDFLSANPFFADNPANADQELRDLVDTAHRAGLYVIMDIVLNHTSNVFAYALNLAGSDAPYSDNRMDVAWRDAGGIAKASYTTPAAVPNPTRDALIWPVELQQNEYFRRQGNPSPDGDDTVGDFPPFKQLSTWETDVQNFLIRAYQYVIARYDIDGFRIDTLRYLKGDLPQIFGNSMREFALSIGKKNFFTFGEVLDGSEETDIAQFIGRNTAAKGDMVGVDAALDYPLFNNLVPTVKGLATPASVVGMYQYRKQVEQDGLSSHGDATRFFVTFLDNHDSHARIRYVPPDGVPLYDNQVTAGLAALFALPGIPCVYYGTEQGLHGAGPDPAVREALWGGPGFSVGNPFYSQIQRIAAVWASQGAMRYGRFYFRLISGDQRNFGVSTTAPGVLAFSRILNDQEVLTVANFSTTSAQTVWVVLDGTLSSPGDAIWILYSNQPAPQPPSNVTQLASGNVVIAEVDGSQGSGPVNVTRVTLQPMEVQILRKG
jgi:glycosidase